MYQEDVPNLHIFGAKTTMTNDFRPPPVEYIKQYHLHKDFFDPHEKPEKKFTGKRGHLCNESLTQLRSNIYVPFNLLWTPKPILSNRKPTRQVVEKPADCGKEESIRTRPRICLQPAVSIDDIEDKKKRDLLLNYMYTTEFRNAEHNVNAFRALNKKKNTECCCGHKEEMADKSFECMMNNQKCRIFSEEKNPSRVAESMRCRYFEPWDSRQRRACVNPTEYFWTHTDIPKNIHVEDGLITPEMRQNIDELIQTDKLRKPHDLTMTGCTAHKVELAYGVPLRRRDFPVSHPMMTMSQTLIRHYEEDMEEIKNRTNLK